MKPMNWWKIIMILFFTCHHVIAQVGGGMVFELANCIWLPFRLSRSCCSFKKVYWENLQHFNEISTRNKNIQCVLWYVTHFQNSFSICFCYSLKYDDLPEVHILFIDVLYDQMFSLCLYMYFLFQSCLSYNIQNVNTL